MPLLSFTHFLAKLLDQSKLQTIRKPRKYPLRVGDLLRVYWKCRTPDTHKLGEARITKIVRKRFCEITAWDFLKDGFEPKGMDPLDLAACRETLTMSEKRGCLSVLVGPGFLAATKILLEAVTAFAQMHPKLRSVAGWREPFDIITFAWVTGPVAPPAIQGIDYPEPDSGSPMEVSKP
jgi:hypothetical protein